MGNKKGMCDSCYEVGKVKHDDSGEWLCEVCYEQVNPTPQQVRLHEKNGRGYITGLGL